MAKYTTLLCNEIYFPPGSIPELIRLSGINFFGSRLTTFDRLQQAMWPGTISDSDKLQWSQTLSNDLRVLTNYEMLGNLFVLSFAHRFLNVVITSAKLYVDKSQMQQKYKFLASCALSTVPALFLIFIVGYPPINLILNACVTQVTATAISYLSLRVGNYLRSLDLISHDKEFSKVSYVTRLLISSAIDIALTFCTNGRALFIDPFKVSDNYHILQYCVEMTNKNVITKMIPSITLSTPLISIADKFVWTVGRMAFDALVLFANKKRIIADIRSPFINALDEIVVEEVDVYNRRPNFTKQERSEYNKAKKEQQCQVEEKRQRQEQEKRKEAKTGSSDKTQSQPKPSSAPSSPTPDTGKKGALPDRPSKIKRRPKYGSLVSDEAPTQEADSNSTRENRSLLINGLTFYDLSRSPANYLCVINPNKIKIDKLPYKFETCLKVGRIASDSDIKMDGKWFELRPSGDERVEGTVYNAIDGLSTMYPLAQAMEMYSALKKENDGKSFKLLICERLTNHKGLGRG